jgi:hypothetical protein
LQSPRFHQIFAYWQDGGRDWGDRA